MQELCMSLSSKDMFSPPAQNFFKIIKTKMSGIQSAEDFAKFSEKAENLCF